MTDNDIIKALECCSVHPMKCKKCPYKGNECCTNAHRKDALDLINRQNAEIERLKNTPFCRVIIDEEKIRELVNEKVQEYELDIKAIKAEAIKEFAERLKGYFETYADTEEANAVYVKNLIDNLVKEMIEGK